MKEDGRLDILPPEFLSLLSKRVSEAKTALSSIDAARASGDERAVRRSLSVFGKKASLASCMALSARLLSPGCGIDDVAKCLGCRWDESSRRLVILDSKS